MAISLQVTSPAPLEADVALGLLSKVRDDLTKTQLVNSKVNLGDIQPSLMSPSEHFDGRWWVMTESEDYLLQIQSDLIAFNWRRKSADGGSDYVGYEVMKKRFNKYKTLWCDSLSFDQNIGIRCCSLTYDNVLPVPDGMPVGEIFSFWNTLGISAVQRGPEIKWGIQLQDKDLGETARLDINAGIGGMMLNGVFQGRAARLMINGFAYPEAIGEVDACLDKLHLKIHELAARLLTPKVRENWNV